MVVAYDGGMGAPERSDPAPPLRGVLLAGIFLALSLLLTWPLGAFDEPRLPAHDDSYFSVWRLHWVATRLASDTRHLFDANIFYPERNTLAFSDAMLLPGLLGAPFIWAGVHPVVVHNALLIASFVSAGCGAALLVRHFTPRAGAQLVAGAIFAFAPYRISHLGHLELLWTAFLPLSLLALYRTLESPTLVRGVQLGLALGLQALCSLYYFIFGVVWLVPATVFGLWHAGVRPTRHHIAAAGMAVMVTGLLVSPYIGPYSQARDRLPPRAVAEVERYSAEPMDFLRVSEANRVYSWHPSDAPDERSLFVGAIPLVLAVTAVVWLRTRVAVAWFVLGLFAFDLALGTNGFSYDLVRRVVPPLDGLRAPARFGVLVLLAVSALAGLTVGRLLDVASTSRRRLITSGLLGGLILEFWSVPVTTRRVELEPPAVYEWLATQPPSVILELPVPRPDSLWHHETMYQYSSIHHPHSLVNGYSGHAPPSYLRALEALRELPSARAAELLKERRVAFVVLHERYMELAEFESLLAACRDTQLFEEVVTFPQDRAAVCRVRRF